MSVKGNQSLNFPNHPQDVAGGADCSVFSCNLYLRQVLSRENNPDLEFRMFVKLSKS